MKGHIRRRGEARELRVFLGTDPVTGKKRYASRTVRGGKRDAQRVLNELAVRRQSMTTHVRAVDQLAHPVERSGVGSGLVITAGCRV
jgi:hypothetical protein